MSRKGTSEKMKDLLLLEKKSILEKAIQDFSVDVDGDEVDEIQGNMLLELSKQLTFRDSNKLKQINTALSKIEDKTYGICEDCEEKIPEKRLLINPCFTTCIGCAEDREIIAQRKRV